MSEVCPVCNGLYEKQERCTVCGRTMEQVGKLEDYNGPYSPYVDSETFVYNNTTDMTGDPCCIHLYECPHCGRIEHGPAQLISI